MGYISIYEQMTNKSSHKDLPMWGRAPSLNLKANEWTLEPISPALLLIFIQIKYLKFQQYIMRSLHGTGNVYVKQTHESIFS